ncbi:MAG: hypothetical protein II001_04665 [Bacteroidales bacterium]|nr:hypothetical protein [Bacteroidales bacterium]
MEPLPILEKKLIIPSYFVDDRSQMTVCSLFQLMQEMSDRHATILGAGWHSLRERGFFWVITKIQMKINRLPKWTEEVTIRTWVRKSGAATSPRDIEIIDSDGQVLVAVSTVWAILDKEKGQPQRMSIFDGCFSPQDRNALEAKPMKIGPVKLPETLPEPMDVRHSDIDINQHVNNAHYIQWAFDAVSDAFRKTHKITGVAVKFIAQAKLGDQYIVCSEPVSDNCFNTAIFSADSNTEYCRLQTEWEAVSMS